MGSGLALVLCESFNVRGILDLLPAVEAAAMLGHDHVLVEIGVFFSKLAVVTFGGAYAVLAYMAQAAVETHGWVTPDAMLDGLTDPIWRS